jgi:hypothetical protein
MRCSFTATLQRSALMRTARRLSLCLRPQPAHRLAAFYDHEVEIGTLDSLSYDAQGQFLATVTTQHEKAARCNALSEQRAGCGLLGNLSRACGFSSFSDCMRKAGGDPSRLRRRVLWILRARSAMDTGDGSATCQYRESLGRSSRPLARVAARSPLGRDRLFAGLVRIRQRRLARV